MADAPRVAVVVPNLFLRWPVETAIRAVGAQPIFLTAVSDAATARCSVLIADLDALGGDAAGALRAVAAADITVLAFGAHVERERLAAARAAGAVALPRSTFLAKLPELLESAVRPRPRDAD